MALTVTQPFAVTATAAPGAWTQINAQGAAPMAAAPALLPPLLANSSITSYADYLKAQPTAAAAASGSIKIKAADFTLPAAAKLAVKIGADDPVITKWNQIGDELSAHATVPQAGWYNVSLHYCSGAGGLISLLLNGKIPFDEAEAFPLESTLGAPPSDGWSNTASDWHDFVLGSDALPAGWKVYLPAGDNVVTLREEGGSGANLAWLSLDPAKS